MNTIENILDDFFHCIKLPIKAIDEKYNLIYKVGVNDELNSFTNSTLFLEKIKNNNDNCPFFIITFKENIDFFNLLYI